MRHAPHFIMRIIRRTLSLLLLTALGATVAPASAASYTNAVWNHDFPDPFVLQAGGRYYAYSTNRGANVPEITSTDLVHWSTVGDALPQLPSWALPGQTWGPSVVFLAGRYVLYYTVHDAGTGLQCISRAESASPEGPFTDDSAGPLICQLDRGGSIDPSPFVDAGGTPWLIFKSEGTPLGEPTRIWSQRMNPDGMGFSPWDPHELLHTDRWWEGRVIEGPSLFADAGAYYLFYSANEWNSPSYATGWARCAGPAGPCFKVSGSPLLSSRGSVAGPGGPSAFRDTAGHGWLAYHGWSSSAVGYDHGGARTLHLDKLDFADGWPVVDGPSAGPVSTARATRVAGADRYETAAAVSASTFSSGVAVAYLATGTGFADALAAGPAAAKRGGPVLLTGPASLPPATATELARLRPASLVVLGGPAAVSAGVLGQAATAAGLPATSVHRVAGADRDATAAAVSADAFPTGAPVAYLAQDRGFADALAGGPAAAHNGAPVLLTGSTSLPAATAHELARLHPSTIVVLGGPAAVADSVLPGIASAAGLPAASVHRVAGPDRWSTAALLSAGVFPSGATVAFAASGTTFADALAAGPAAAMAGAPLLLTRPTVAPDATVAEVERLHPASLVVLGGPAAVNQAAFARLDVSF
ncbi:MAG: glycoside hydrolase, family 43 [Acidimicrobiales bacterium]|nr:glycoside hydrolase, family 43 [Acidimicrobiales bacterium]